MNTLIKRLLAPLLISVLITACGGTSLSGLSAQDDTWQLISGELDGQAMDLSQSDKNITLSFVDDAMVGNGSVNQYRFPVRISSGSIYANGPLITTRMAGSMSAMQLEHSYFSALEQADTINRGDGILTISGRNVRLTYRQLK